MAIAERKLILKVLKEEHCWLTFDELYDRAQADCDWIAFALRLERLVKRGHVRHVRPYGSDDSYYKIARSRRKRKQGKKRIRMTKRMPAGVRIGTLNKQWRRLYRWKP